MSTSNTDTGDTSSIMTSSTLMDAAADPSAIIAPPREALITTAVNFLQNAKVRHTTLMQKQQFLRSKGLSAEEIQLACERAGVFTQDPNKPTVINMGISSQSQLAMPTPPTTYGRIKEILHSMAIASAVAYAIYMFYKKYIEPLLFGKKKKKTIEESLQEIEKTVDTRIEAVNRELTLIKDTLVKQNREQTQQINREFRSDLEAIKGLLLNSKQFAAPSNLLSGVPTSIPAWQLASSPHHRHRHSQSDDNEKTDDAGSGSGSSETEVVTKNSDSSLEIM